MHDKHSSKLAQFFDQLRRQPQADLQGSDVRPFATALTELVAGGQSFTLVTSPGDGGDN
jgi:hypothetical protein